LQLIIMATGNFGFFNLLTIALSLPLLDDDVLPAVVARHEIRPAVNTLCDAIGRVAACRLSGGARIDLTRAFGRHV
jgi:hypothetical protein